MTKTIINSDKIDLEVLFMDYRKPFGEFIKFDNSDIIVTSKLVEQTCTNSVPGIVCRPNADDSLPNECGWPGIPEGDWGSYICFVLEYRVDTCTAGVNSDYVNSPPRPPMSNS